MTATVSIGEFSRLTYLSVKTLRHYHDVGLLAPVDIDAHSGYRRYSTDQVTRAHLIRRLRGLDMPIPEIRAVLEAPDTDTRDAALRAHLERMEEQLQRTRDAVASLRALLTPAAPLAVRYRTVDAFPVLAVRDVVTRDAIGDWCQTSFALLYETLAAVGREPGGPGGATYSMEFFENESGEVLAYVPLADGAPFTAPEGAGFAEMPARRFAITEHRGSFEDFDRTYGALGSHVAEHDTALREPVHEIYLISPADTGDPSEYLTEVCWPIETP